MITKQSLSKKQTISVLGATGKTGRRVAAQLQQEGHQVREASRRGSLRFDWDIESSWPATVDGADSLYIVPSEAPEGNERLANFIDMASKANVQRLVLLSAREWVDLNDTNALAREDIVRESRLEWTILRPVWFAQNFSEEDFFSAGITSGELVHGTGEGRHPFVNTKDIAAVAVAALTDDQHASQHYTLTGPRAISISEAVEGIAKMTGRSIRTRSLDHASYHDYLTQHYYSTETADAVVALSDFISGGEDDYLSDGVRRALGREPLSFSDYVTDTIENGGWA